MVNLASALVFAVLLGIVDSQSIKDYPEEDYSPDGSQKWGYVNVRRTAHMFYWLYNTSHRDGPEGRPWVMWLQGGPGASSSGFGNFQIIGPLNVDLQPRNTTWIKQVSVLFVDAPVGAGFSYVDDESAYNTQVRHIVDDLMKFLRVFLERTPIFKTRPLYIFGQSYGGKVAAYLSRRLHDEIRCKQIEIKLIGFSMGNAWISPMDYVMNYADFALAMSLVDEHGWEWIQKRANEANDCFEGEQYVNSLRLNWRCQTQFAYHSNLADIYDISKFITVPYENVGDALKETMNLVKMSKQLIIPKNKTWSDTRKMTFDFLTAHYMKPSISVVADLLETTDLQVIIYQGQLDLIANTKGTMDWVQKLKWSNLTGYNSAERKALINPADNQTEGFVKAYGKFKFYTILGAGHAVPHDKGDAAYRMLDRILNNLDQ